MLIGNSPVYGARMQSWHMPTIGARVAALREARGLSQPELAKRIGISQPSLFNIENGRTKTLRGKTLAGLCRELGTTPEVILEGKRTASMEAMLHEQELLSCWRALTPADQEHLLAIARALRDRMRPPSSPRPDAAPSAPITRPTPLVS